QKFQPLPNLGQYVPRDNGRASFEFDSTENAARGPDRHLGEIVNRRTGLAFGNLQAHGPAYRVEARPLAFRTHFAIPFLPFEPRFFDGVGARATVHVGQIKQFSEPAATRAPSLGRVVTEV